MPVKHFVVNPERGKVDKAAAAQSRLEEMAIHKEAESAREISNRERLAAKDDLKHLPGRIVVKVNLESKNFHRLTESLTIRRERQYNNFNRRETEPVNAVVISGANIPTGVEILIHHNALHDSNKIFDYGQLSGKTTASDIKFFSIPETECFLWKDKSGKWIPLKGFATGLRVFKPYTGILQNIDPTQFKNVLYITSGELKDKVVHTLRACDYELIFQGSDGREQRIIRCRHYENEDNDKEEIIAISDYLTEKVESGEYWVGLDKSSAKPITQNVPDHGVY